ncbi:hypothetical protein [Aurantiacibacter poecillastricola]|uniref:hypothetical protein n=1 Tax=Aurantiacibacter poecillastricola TaxID=3064385 RepID=UPI00273E4E6D|nr:hypothetical protein [Aurantiacibacter sp. 219JJ12-13]MDP5261322.1 hypothetical protein [Aurantiacibacter sp. 219JJ12-13]
MERSNFRLRDFVEGLRERWVLPASSISEPNFLATIMTTNSLDARYPHGISQTTAAEADAWNGDAALGAPAFGKAFDDASLE